MNDVAYVLPFMTMTIICIIGWLVALYFYLKFADERYRRKSDEEMRRKVDGV